MYQAIFGRKAEKSLRKIPRNYQVLIKEAVLMLEKNPYTHGTIKLINHPVASYRHRVADYRILFDVEEDKQIMILDIKRRTTTTY